MLEFGYASHKGLKKQHNEDTYFMDTANGFFLLADGMGEGIEGSRCAALARDTAVGALNQGSSPKDAMQQVINFFSKRHHQQTCMAGTTLLIVKLANASFEVAWVGSDQLFLFKNGLYALSDKFADHSALIKQGILKAPEKNKDGEISAHQAYNAQMHVIGVTDADKIHMQQVNGHLQDHMSFLLATDGLMESIPATDVRDTLCREDISPQEMADKLILAVLEKGGQDNTTALIVRHVKRAYT